MDTKISLRPVFNEKTILIVDDSNLTRNLIERVYKEQYKVLMAADGDQAMQIIDVMPEGSIATILLDLNMPNANGFGVLDYFREKGYLEKIPVVIITGEANATVIERIKKGYNVAAILLKPFSVQQIDSTVTKAINEWNK